MVLEEHLQAFEETLALLDRDRLERGWGWIRSRRKLPRNSSLPKLGSIHSVSRAASTTFLPLAQ